MKKAILLALLLFFLQGCLKSAVQPWEKGTLAKDTMSLGGLNPPIKKFDEHIYFSKEGSKGGSGISGGGCGCN